VTTNPFGLVNLIVGDNADPQDFDNVNWGEQRYFLKVRLRYEGQTEDLGRSEILGSPYASISKEAIDGVPGAQGPPGPKGEDGAGVKIVGSVWAPGNLPSNYNGDVGDMYIMESDGTGWVWDGSDWIEVGQIRGPEGPEGPPGDDGFEGPQ